MAKEFKYAVRGRAGAVRYKIVNGAFKKVGEARGEDLHLSRFTAIYQASKALRAWGMRPQGIVLDVIELEYMP